MHTLHDDLESARVDLSQGGAQAGENPCEHFDGCFGDAAVLVAAELGGNWIGRWFTFDGVAVAAFAGDNGKYLLAHFFDDAAAIHGCFFGQLREKGLHASLKVHFNAMAEDLHQQFEDVLEEDGGVVVEEVQDGRPVLGEDVGDVGGVLLANGSDHGDALVAGGPVPLDVAVELAEELLV